MSILNKLTLKQLQANKKRTFLTGFSITMIVSLLTAIVVFVSSIWLFAYNNTVQSGGDWHMRTNIISKQHLSELKSASFIASSVDLPADTWTLNPEKNADLPFDGTVTSLYNIQNQHVYHSDFYRRITGRLPENANEVFIALEMNRNIIGKQVTLTQNGHDKVLTVVGYGSTVSSPNDNPFVVLHESLATQTQFIAFAKADPLDNTLHDTLDNYTQATNNVVKFEPNSALLSLLFVSDHEAIGALRTLVIITVVIVAIISIIVTSSSFMLSLNERLKQLGVLSSVGTTRRQIRIMMLLESFWVGSVSIILGLGVGIIGIGIPITLMKPLVAQLFAENTASVPLEMVLFPEALLSVVIISAIIIVCAALFPSIRAGKRSPIENIKQVPFKNIFVFKQNKTTKAGKKRFGMPAYLAKRYTKHNKSRSRVVFTLLTISLITFNVLANLLTSTENSLGHVAVIDFKGSMNEKVDALLFKSNNSLEHDITTIVQGLSTKPGVTDVYAETSIIAQTSSIDTTLQTGNKDREISIVTLSPNVEEKLLKHTNVTPEAFKTHGIFISYDTTKPDSETGKLTLVNAVANSALNGQTITFKAIGSESEHTFQIPVAQNITGENLPFSLSHPQTLVVSHDYAKQLNAVKDVVVTRIALNFSDKSIIDQTLTDFVNENPEFYPNNAYSGRKTVFAFLSILQILTYGFLSLISIICVTTLFNTLTSHASLRQREFAILRSIGMTVKQLKTMLTIENMKTGVVSILVAIVVSYGLTYALFQQTSNSIVKQQFVYPILPTLISSTLLFVILLVFNVFTQRSIVKRSIVEDIRQENI